MAGTQIQYRRGTTANHTTFTGAVGEMTIDTDKKVVVVHDGTTAGGNPQMRQDCSNMPAGSITPARLANAGAELGIHNRIINGAMVIDQRNSGASYTVPGTAVGYCLDRWNAQSAQASKFSVQQNAGAVTPPAGFTNYLGVTSLSSYTSIAADYFDLTQTIEGYSIADLSWGTASAKSVTLQFWAYSSLTGTFSGSLTNNAGTYSYIFNYSIPVANTWTYISVTILGPTVGVWVTNNGMGVSVRIIDLGSGSTYKTSTVGSWVAGNINGSTGSVSIVGTSGATFYVTGVQLEKGSTATPFEFRPYGVELALCQRYYWRLSHPFVSSNFSAYATGAYMTDVISFPSEMRISPTISSNFTGATLGSLTIQTPAALSSKALKIPSVSTGANLNCYWLSASGNYVDATAEL